ncbi:MAG: hypothetical protein CM1200mP13_13070 [Candidatus Pelagibacterales bacterium]|nr:MAG: hypothetical protein CM1200mP13_13070 [Pelagibacterales bacterium]
MVHETKADADNSPKGLREFNATILTVITALCKVKIKAKKKSIHPKIIKTFLLQLNRY